MGDLFMRGAREDHYRLLAYATKLEEAYKKLSAQTVEILAMREKINQLLKEREKDGTKKRTTKRRVLSKKHKLASKVPSRRTAKNA